MENTGDIKIGRALEEEQEKEQFGELQDAMSSEMPEEGSSTSSVDTKAILIGIVALIGIFALIFGGFKLYDNMTGAQVIDIDQLHEDNLEGDLKDDEAYTYNGFSFVLAEGLWWTEAVVNKGDGNILLKVPLHFGPRDLENVTFTGTLSEDFNEGLDVYFAIDPTLADPYISLAISELGFNIIKGVGRKPVTACTFEDDICGDYEILSCENNPENKPIIEFVLDTEVEAAVEKDGTCIKVIGHDYGIVRAADKLVLEWYDVI